MCVVMGVYGELPLKGFARGNVKASVITVIWVTQRMHRLLELSCGCDNYLIQVIMFIRLLAVQMIS